MRQRQQLFLSINRIFLLLYTPLSVALGVYYLFTGNLIHAMLSVCTVLWLVLPHVIHHTLHLKPGQLLLFFYYVFILFGYSGGIVLSFSQKIPLYDELIYLTGGFLLCIFAAVFFCCFMKQRPKKQNMKFSNLFCFCFAMAVSTVWKLLQITAMLLVLKISPGAYDVVCDLTSCLIGAAVYCCLTALYLYRDIHTYPLYAIEDFSALNIESTVKILKK